MVAEQAGESTYYNQNGAFVTNARAVLAGTTYPLTTITSAEVGRSVPSALPAIAMFGLAGLSLVLLSGLSWWFGVGGLLVFGALGVILLLQSRKVAYYVRLGTTGGERQALAGYEKTELEKIVAALNEAIIGRR